ncbi:MAG: hypothetical protein SGPRY_010048, partial [Prymnesium sp.]
TADGSPTLLLSDPELQGYAEELLTECTSIRCFSRRLITPAGKSVCTAHFEHATSSITLLWSHGNAEDLGHVFFACIQIAQRLGVSIVAYDYEGYGLSTGTPDERALCSDILCVYDHLIESGLRPEQIVLYGQSVGSGPSVWLATKRHVRALVLHSPLASGLRSLIPQSEKTCSPNAFCSPLFMFATCDMFPNFKRIARVLDISHTMQLHKNCPPEYRRDPYIVDGAGRETAIYSKINLHLSSSVTDYHT